ncbi:MAG TPA: hypothetical protein VIF57_00270 [Polyangia bacterium]
MTTRAPRVQVGFLALLVGALFFSALSTLSPAAAHAASKRVGVPKFDGVQEALVRKKVMQILKAHGYDLAKSREMEIGLANTGALLDNDEGFQKVAKELALGAIVTGEIGKKRAKLGVHDGKDGSLLGEASFAGANPRKIAAAVASGFWSKLGSAIEQGKPPSGAKKPQKVVAEAPEDNENAPDAGEAGGEAEPAPEPTKTKSKKGTEVAAAEGGGEELPPSPPPRKKKKKKVKMEGEGADVVEPPDEVMPPTFDFQVGPGFINRSLAYHQDISSPGLRSYALGAGPSVVASIVWYPLGPFVDGALQGLGVEGHIEQAFLISSSLPSDAGCGAQGPDCFPTGAKFNTTVHEFSGGARYRMPFGAGHFFYGTLTGGEHAFTFKTTDATKPRSDLGIPDTIYRYLRPGIGVHFELPAQLSFMASVGYRWIFNKGGQFHDVFPYSSVNGVDGSIGLGYRISPMLEVRASGDWRRYFSSMNCNATTMVCTQRFVAGGAVDQYFSGSVTLAVTMGGTEIKMPEQAEEPPPPPKRKRKASEDEDAGGGDEGGGGGDE